MAETVLVLPQPSLFDPPHHDDPADDEPVLVKLKSIRLERLRDFGDVWLALGLWRLLGLDQLLPHKEAIEQHLKERLGDLFDLDCELLLYDVTSTYFEGERKSNPMAKRGYSRDSRPDCLQVCIGLVVTTDGVPPGYEVFDGNAHDSTTVETIVGAMETKYGRANRIWVMDRGMVSEDNLKFLRQRGGSYIVGTPKAMLRRFEQYLTEKDWHEVQAGVEVKLVPGPDGEETFVPARSADRREKE